MIGTLSMCCRPDGGVCAGNDDCCGGFCAEGVCREPCGTDLPACAAGTECLCGSCKPPAPLGAPCEQECDCGTSSAVSCVNHTCTQTCTTNAGCAAGDSCVCGHCEPARGVGSPCPGNQQCACGMGTNNTLYCDEGVCRGALCASCTIQADCSQQPHGESCQEVTVGVPTIKACCGDVGTPCTNDGECCQKEVCSPTSGHCVNAGSQTPPHNTCWAFAGTGGGMPTCEGSGSDCDDNTTCCDGLFCFSNNVSGSKTCLCHTANQACNPADETDSNHPQCCGGLGCKANPSGNPNNAICGVCTKAYQSCDITVANDCCIADGYCSQVVDLSGSSPVFFTECLPILPAACADTGEQCRFLTPGGTLRETQCVNDPPNLVCKPCPKHVPDDPLSDFCD